MFRQTPLASLMLSIGIALLGSVPVCGQSSKVAVGPQFETTHVYTDEQHMDVLVRSLLATFGGHATDRLTLTVTPTPSVTLSQLVITPFGMLSIFAFKTPVPAPFGGERTGYLVQNMDEAIAAAKASGAEVLVQTFKDPVGLDSVVRWPGGLETQLYWHFKAPQYAAFQTVPENRLYVSAERVDEIARDFATFSGGKIILDEHHADGAEVGQPGTAIRKVQINSNFGCLTLYVTNGHLTYPFGTETTGYEVSDLEATLNKARASGAKILVSPTKCKERTFAMVSFPSDYVAEIHASPTSANVGKR